MKKLPVVGEEIMYKINDSFLEENIRRYNDARAKTNKVEDAEEYFDAYNKVLKILAYRSLVYPESIEFLDNKIACQYRKGRLPQDFDIEHNEKTRVESIIANIRAKNSQDPYERYLVLCSSGKTLDTVAGVNYVTLKSLPEVYEAAVKNDPSLNGILIDPGLETNFFVTRTLCEYIVKGCPEKEWEEIVKGAKDAVGKMVD